MEKNLESEFQGHQCHCTSFCLYKHSVCFILFFFFFLFFLESTTNEYWLVVNASV